MRQIIILDTPRAGDGKTVVTGFNWFPIANVLARVPKPGFQSAGSALDAAHQVTGAEQAALEDGSVREERFNLTFSASTTRVQIEGELARQWTDRKAAIDAEAPSRQFFGRSWDGTTWTA